MAEGHPPGNAPDEIQPSAEPAGEKVRAEADFPLPEPAAPPVAPGAVPIVPEAVVSLVKRIPLAYPGIEVPIVAFPFPEPDFDDEDAPGEGQQFDLPDPPDEFNQPPRPEDLPPRNPQDWPSPPLLPEDPVNSTFGVFGSNPAALFVSDFHFSDGGVGDDYQASHLVSSPPLVIGNSAAGPSRAGLFAAVLNFAAGRLAALGIPRFDIVLNGDTIDMLELIGRGSTLSPVHNGFFGALAATRAAGNTVYYLRGNHDFVVPPSPLWIPGVFYANGSLQTFAEHGDFHDPFNWPPGLGNPGSIFVVGAGAGIETLVTDFTIFPPAWVYELAGIDNVRPFSAATITGFLRARVGLATRVLAPAVAAAINAADLAARIFGGLPNDFQGVTGALRRFLSARFFQWLQVQGHTHIPLALPSYYYNTGTWTPYIITAGGVETILETFPFLLVYLNPATGRRTEEFFLVQFAAGGRATATLSSRARVNRLRVRLGYRRL